MAFSHQTSLHQGGLDDDPNQSFDASSYINDDGDSPEPFDNLEADPLSSETDSGVHDIMHDMQGENGMNHFLNHGSSGNPGDITFVSDNLAGDGAPFENGLSVMAPAMHMDVGQDLNRSYRIAALNMDVENSEGPGNPLNHSRDQTLEDSATENGDTLSGNDMTPRAVKTAFKPGTRLMDHQRYAAAMQQHHHAGNTLFSVPVQLSKRADEVDHSISPTLPTAGEGQLAQPMTTTPLQRLLQSSAEVSGHSSAMYAHVNVKREPIESGMNHFYAEPSDSAPGTATGVPLQIRPFEQFDAEETGQEDDDDDAVDSAIHGAAEGSHDKGSAEERSSDSSAIAGRKQKRPDKGKGKDTSSGLEIDDAEGGMNPEADLAVDGDIDDENARRKIKIEYIEDKSRRHITFSKRKAGIMKKAYELSILTGTQVLLLVVSETGLCYTYTTPKMSPMVTQPAGQQLIQACLNAPEGYGPDGEVLKVPSAPSGSKKDKNELAIRPLKLNAEELANLAAASASASDPTTPKKKKPSKPTLEGKEGKPGGAAAAQNRRRASEKVKRAASGAAKKGSRVTSDPSAGARSQGEHDMDFSQQPPPVPPLPAGLRTKSSNTTAVTNSANINGATLMQQHPSQPDVQPGVSLVSPISAVFSSSHSHPGHHHQQQQHRPAHDYPEYHTHPNAGTGPHYYQAQAVSVPQTQQPQSNGLVPVQINYSYPTPNTQYIDQSQAGVGLHPQQMQRQQSQHQSLSHVAHSTEPHSQVHQQYAQSLADAHHYSANQPHPGQMIAGPIGMGGQI